MSKKLHKMSRMLAQFLNPELKPSLFTSRFLKEQIFVNKNFRFRTYLLQRDTHSNFSQIEINVGISRL